jgi:hypothetical protein
MSLASSLREASLAGGLALAAACGSGGADPATSPGGAGGEIDGGVSVDGAPGATTANGGAPLPGDYGELTSATAWSFHDLASTFHGGTFDGRYVYFAPRYPGRMLARYDTTAPFDATTSWEMLDLQTVNALAPATGFTGGGGANFDGRYLYVIGSGVNEAVVLRYDVTASFTVKASWAASALPSTKALGGSAFDGRYLYVVEASGYQQVHALRYDTTAEFTAASWESWRSFSLGVLRQSVNTGVLFDGRYVYFVPAGSSLVRYDTRMPFTLDDAWTNQGAPASLQFLGGAFDGRSIYLVPNLDPNGGGGFSGSVARYAPENAGTALWSTFDTKVVDTKATGFNGAGYDGRFLYLVPFYNGANSGLLVRYDTADDFSARGSWSAFDIASLNPQATSFAGSVFDGRYLYFAGKTIARFDARNPVAMPPLPGFHGAFR